MATTADRIRGLLVTWGRELGEKFGETDNAPARWDGSPIPGTRVSVDDTGLNGVCDFLARHGVYTDRVNFGAREDHQWLDLVGDQLFRNQRAEMHWCARRGLQEGVFRVPLEFRAIWQECQWVHFEREMGTDGTLIKLEPKDKIRARHGRSPDYLDAFVLACRQTPGKVFSRGDHLYAKSERLRQSNFEKKRVLGRGSRLVRPGQSIAQAASRRR